METFTLDTPTSSRSDNPVQLVLCGEEMTVNQPKQMAILSARTATSPMLESEYGDDADRVRANSVLGFVMNTFRMEGYSRFLDRALDANDPLDLDELYRAMEQLVNRWDDYDPQNNPPVVINPSGQTRELEQARMVLNDAGIDVIATRPKALLLMLVSALSLSSDMQAEKIAIERFLEATLYPEDAQSIIRRLNLPDDIDSLDIEHLDPVITRMIEHWFPSEQDVPVPANRDERRAAANAGRHHTAPSL